MTSQEHEKISPTAYLGLYHKRNSGIKYAKELAQVSNSEEIAREFIGPEVFPKMEFVGGVFEAKYRAVEKYMSDNPDHSVLQLGCAFLTHGLFVPNGMHYLGLDLPDIIEARRKIFADVQVEYPGGYKDMACNVLDRKGLEKAVRDFLPRDRKILVVHESLLYHFTLQENAELMDTLAELGREYGLTWANTDIAIKQNKEVVSANPLFADIMRLQSGKTGRDMMENAYPSVDAVAELLTSKGFEFDKEKDIHPLYKEGDFVIRTLAPEGRARQLVLTILSNMKTYMSRINRR